MATYEENLKAGLVVPPFQSYTPGPITSDVLKPVAPINYETPKPEILPDVKNLNTETTFDLTKPETEASDLTKLIQGMNNDLVGETAYRAEQETAQGIPALQKTQTDLSAQLNALINESKAIPLQIQNQFEGRGATTGGARPFETSALRENAIKALSISSLLEASKGNLALANDMVDRAVTAKYGATKEKIATAKANLDLIIKSPEYSLADKKRAQEQKDIQDKKEFELEKAKENMKNVYNISLKAAENGASSEVIQALQGASSPVEALRIATLAGALKGKKETSVVEVGGRKLLIDTQTGTTVKDLGPTTSSVAGGSGSPAVDSWVGLIQTGQASIASVPAALKSAVAIQLSKTPQAKEASTLKTQALTSAQELLTKLTEGKGTSAVGKSAFLASFGYGFVPGTQAADFKIQFNNLKSLLSLDNVKFLKGQGQVSDAERKLLAEAAAKLELGQSEGEFKKALEDVVKGLSGTGELSEITGTTRLLGPDGVEYDVPNGQVEAFLAAGGKRI